MYTGPYINPIFVNETVTTNSFGKPPTGVLSPDSVKATNTEPIKYLKIKIPD